MKKLIAAVALLTATPAMSRIDLTVDRSDLEVTIKQDGKVVDVKPVAMGKPGDATPLGSWKIHEVHMNPDWRSTRDGTYYPSGPEVPLGRVRLRYNMPYALHGTNKPESIGTYASLGCIRMLNEDVIDLARLILKDTGNWGGDDWFQRMLDNPLRQYQVRLSQPVYISVVE